MKMIRRTAILGAMCVLLTLSAAQAGVVARHVEATDPETEGWEKDFYDQDPYWAYTSALTPDAGYGVDAWQIRSGSGGSSIGGKGAYMLWSGSGWLTDQGYDPLAEGFTLSAKARVAYDPDSQSNGRSCFSIRGNGWMYQNWLFAEAALGQADFDGTNGVTVFGLWHSSGLTYETLGPQQEYYKIDMVYTPGVGAAYYINDSLVPIHDSLGPGATGATVGNLWWGQPDNGDGARSDVNWNSVVLDVGDGPLCGDLDHPAPLGDLDTDCAVNLTDFAIMAAHWLEQTFP